MRTLILSLIFFASVASAQTATPVGQVVLSEFSRLRNYVSKLEPEFEVGGFLKGKNFGDHKLLWRLGKEKGDSEIIRIFREKTPSTQSLDVAFHHNDAIVPGRMVVRRFIGPAATGWRNDTVDAETGEYFGRQGVANPRLDQRDLEILRQWEIVLPEN